MLCRPAIRKRQQASDRSAGPPVRNGTRRLARPRDRPYQVGGSCRVRPGRKDPATCRCTHTRRYEPLARGAAQESKEHSRLLRWAPSPCPRRPCTPARRHSCRPDQRNAGQAACRNRHRRPHDPRTPLFPTVGHFASWAGACPGPQGISRSPPLRANPSRAAVAHRPAQRMRTRRRAHQRHLPRRALRPATRPARRTNSDRGDPPRPARRVLPHRPRPRPLPRPRTRLATQALLGRGAPRPTLARASSKRSATPSRSSKSTNQKPNKPLNQQHNRAGLTANAKAGNHLRPKRPRISGIHRSASMEGSATKRRARSAVARHEVAGACWLGAIRARS